MTASLHATKALPAYNFKPGIIILSGFLVGTADIMAALFNFYLNTGKPPFAPVLKFIASGVVGRAAFQGGNSMIVLGLFLHYIIAFSFTLFFFFIYKKLKSLCKNWILMGSLYGLFIWMVMSFVIVPLSKTPPIPPGSFDKMIVSILILVCMIGIPLTLIASIFCSDRIKEMAPEQRHKKE